MIRYPSASRRMETEVRILWSSSTRAMVGIDASSHVPPHSWPSFVTKPIKGGGTVTTNCNIEVFATSQEMKCDVAEVEKIGLCSLAVGKAEQPRPLFDACHLLLSMTWARVPGPAR